MKGLLSYKKLLHVTLKILIEIGPPISIMGNTHFNDLKSQICGDSGDTNSTTPALVNH